MIDKKIIRFCEVVEEILSEHRRIKQAREGYHLTDNPFARNPSTERLTDLQEEFKTLLKDLT